MEEKKQLYHVATAADEANRGKRKKGPEEKQYLICIKALQGSGLEDEWEICEGRSEAREYIKTCVDYIDFERSFVLVESCVLADRKSIYTFMKHIEQFYNDGFDIDDYVRGDWSEDDYIKSNNIDTSIYTTDNLVNRLTMDQLMGSDINSIPLE